MRVWNLEKIKKQNRGNARCLCWILRNITDPGAVGSAICLAANIQWFDGNSDYDPPFAFIITTFETCFDSNKRLYPIMKIRTYSLAQTILQINAGARA